MQRIYTDTMQSPLGVLRVFCDDTHIIRLLLGEGNGAYPLQFFGRYLGQVDFVQANDTVKRAREELAAYFNGTLRRFTIPVRLYGTPFEKSVLGAVAGIPYGRTASYADVARGAGTRGVRAAGSAIGRNPVPILIPCHRVIHADGSLGGFTGGIEKKIFLQRLEGIIP